MYSELPHDLKIELNRIIELNNAGELSRMGKLFSTSINNYFYDTGTGKVINIDDEIYFIMHSWFSNKNINSSEFLNNTSVNKKSLKELLKVILDEHLLSSKKPDKLYTPNHYENLEDNLNNNLEQLILEVTGKCNLRCKYCVYNDQYVYARAFNSDDLSQDTAKKAIDYFFDHSKNEIAITFYGGEPLLKIELIKWSILYSIEKNKLYNKKLSFGLTSNMTLMTQEIADFFASIPDISILCSIDGPREIHDSYRKCFDGTSSFDKAIKGLENLSNAYNVVGKHFAINTVFAPPYTYEKLDMIDEFFSELSFLPKDTKLGITYPSLGSVDSAEWNNKMVNNPKYKSSLTEDVNPLWEWRRKKILEGFPLDIGGRSIVTCDIEKDFNFIDNRIVSNKPNTIYPLNGCCVPGKRRLYVDLKGDYYPCERIGTSPNIGNINDGIDIERIKKYYIDDFVDASLEKCSNCWAVKMCQLCYAGRFNSSEFIGSKNECNGTRHMLERMLSFNHELLEGNRDRLKSLENVEVV
jgi:uncharacterized protein